jgi:tetratricopeptide (TPR) repeat protein
MITIIMGISGFLLLILGQVRFSKYRKAEGCSVRAIGLLLLAPFPVTYIIGYSILGPKFAHMRPPPTELEIKRLGETIDMLVSISLLILALVLIWRVTRPVMWLSVGDATIQTGFHRQAILDAIDEKSLFTVDNGVSPFSVISVIELDKWVHYRKGITYLAKSSLNAALAELTRYIQLKPENTHGYVKRAQVYYEKRMSDQALADLQHVLIIDPNHVEAQRLHLVISQTRQSLPAGTLIGDDGEFPFDIRT